MPDPIDLITAAPNENYPDTIATEIDLFIQQIKARIPQFNFAITAFNFNATNSTSTTSLTIGIGSKSLTVQSGKSYVPGMAVTIAYTSDATKWMRGEVMSFDSGTGALLVDVRFISTMGGTFTAWTISQAAIDTPVGNHVVTLHTGNNAGSTNTAISNFTTISENIGTALTGATSATLGASITVNEPGLYEVFCGAYYANTSYTKFGASRNSNQLTTAIDAIAESNRIICLQVGGSGVTGLEGTNQASRIIHCVASDVIRYHTMGGGVGAAANVFGKLSVRKVAHV